MSHDQLLKSADVYRSQAPRIPTMTPFWLILIFLI